MRAINILVLGVGGNVSQGILKAIRQSGISCKLLGACISEESLGLYFCDKALISPYANSCEFIPWLVDTCNEELIDIVLTGVEENIIEIAKNIELLRNKTTTIFEFTNYAKLKIGQDKYDTCCWLRSNDCNFPMFALAEDELAISKIIKKCGFPLIAKPRKGKGSQGIVMLHTEEDLNTLREMEDYVVQEYVGSSDSEFTVGSYCDQNGKLLNHIIMKRELRYGTTFKAEIVDDVAISNEVVKICESFKPVGPLNIQLRKNKDGKPVCFELNVRFSGTTPIRAHFGFNDVATIIREYVLGEDISTLLNVRKGIAYRVPNEVYFDVNVMSDMKKNSKIDDMSSYVIAEESFGL